MSLSIAEASYLNGATSQWIKDHLWTGIGQVSTILVVEQVNSSSQYDLLSGFSNIQVSTGYTVGSDELDGLTVSLDIPSYGLVVLAQESTYTLSSDDGQNLTISAAGGMISGDVAFKYAGDGDNMEVITDYALNLPYSSSVIQGSVSIFPTDLQRVNIESLSSQSATNGKRSERKARAHMETRANGQDELLADCLSDFIVDDIFVIGVSDQGSNGTAALKQKRDAPSPLYHVDLMVPVRVGFIYLTASVDSSLDISGELYLKSPFIPQIYLGSVTGNLQPGVALPVNTPLVSGKATFNTSPNASGGNSDFYLQCDFPVSYFGPFSTGNIRALTLPF